MKLEPPHARLDVRPSDVPVGLDAVEDRLVLGPSFRAPPFLGFEFLPRCQFLPVFAAGNGRIPSYLTSRWRPEKQGDGDTVAAAMFDPHQPSAAEHRNEGPG